MMALKQTKNELVWMMQHIGADLWSIGANNRIHRWTLTQVVADKGIFPFNIFFICQNKKTGDTVAFTMKDIGECLFRSEKAASVHLSKYESEEPAV